MPKFVQILVVTLIAILATGSVIHAASTSTMAVKMTLADNGTMNVANCTNCNADGNGIEGGPSCDIACLIPLVADLGTRQIPNTPVAISSPAPNGGYDFVDRTAQPEPHPPRTLI